jgi:hypothetical protein
MKKRISIYIDSDIWEDVKTEARNRSALVGKDISASQLSEDALRGFLSCLPKRCTECHKIMKHCECGEKPTQIVVSQIYPDEWCKRVSGGQAKLDASRKGRDIKKEKIAKIKAGPVMSSNFNPQPKKANIEAVII